MKIFNILKSKEDNTTYNLDKNIKDLEQLSEICIKDIEKIKQYLRYLDPKNREIILQESIVFNEKSFIVPKCHEKDFNPNLVTTDDETNKFIEEIKIKYEEIGKKIVELIKFYNEENKLTSLKNKEIKELQQLKELYRRNKKKLEEFLNKKK